MPIKPPEKLKGMARLLRQLQVYQLFVRIIIFIFSPSRVTHKRKKRLNLTDNLLSSDQVTSRPDRKKYLN